MIVGAILGEIASCVVLLAYLQYILTTIFMQTVSRINFIDDRERVKSIALWTCDFAKQFSRFAVKSVRV